MVELSTGDRKQLLSLLENLPEMASERSRRQFLPAADLGSLANRIDVSGAPSVAVAEIVDRLSRHGRTESGCEALGSFLSSIREIVGIDRREFLDRLLEIYHMMVPEPGEEDAGKAIAVCPYRGLEAFQESDADFFFGRNQVVKELVDRIRRESFTAVIGPSGSGKSSVVFAGAIPELRKESDWRIVRLRPGNRPLENLALALVPLLETGISETTLLTENAPNLCRGLLDNRTSLCNIVNHIVEKYNLRSLLLVVDQFEELYALNQVDPDPQNISIDERELKVFLDNLLEATRFSHHFKVVITLRADFLSYALAYRSFADMLQSSNIKFLVPMNRKELQEAIQKPADKLGVSFEKGLIKKIVDVVEEKSGYLPLLEFALTQLWEKQERGVLTHTGYEGIGEVEMALARHADEEYKRLDKLARQQAEHIFIQLVRPGEGTEDTRRLATRQEVGKENWNVVRRLANSRLVVTGSRAVKLDRSDEDEHEEGDREVSREETVEIVHEALIKKWRLLRDWIDRHRDFRKWQERLRASIRQWEVSNHNEGALLRGFPLDEAIDWKEKYSSYVRPEERRFIDLSWETFECQEIERQRQEIERREREIELRIMSEANETLENANETLENANETLENANRQAKKQIRIGGFVFFAAAIAAAIVLAFAGRSAYFAREGTRLEQAGNSALRQMRSGEIEALLSAMRGAQQLQDLVGESDRPSDYPALSPILALHQILQDIREENRLKMPLLEGEVKPLEVKRSRFSPDGEAIATVGFEGTVRLWDRGGEEIARLEGHEPGPIGGVNDIAFSPDGKLAVTAGGDETVRLWDLVKGRQRALMKGHTTVVNIASFRPDGKAIATADDFGRVIVWDLQGNEQQQFQAHSGPVRSVRFAPDGQTLLTAGDSAVRLWTPSGEKVREIEARGGEEVLWASFSPDGKTIATAGGDRFGRLWTLDGKELVRLEGHAAGVVYIGFSPDGRSLATTSDDGTARIWDLAGTETARLQGHRGVVWGADFSPDGDRVVTSGRDGTVRLWNLAGAERQEVVLAGLEADINAIAVRPDGKEIAGASHGGIVQTWRADGQPKKQWVANPQGPLWAIAYHPAGNILATGGWGATVTLWDAETGDKVRQLRGHEAFVQSIAFSEDGRYLASASGDNTARLWDAETGDEVAMLEHDNVVGAVDVEGDRIATADWDGKIRVWARSGELLRAWQGHDSQVRTLDFEPTGKLLVTGDEASLVKVWNVNGTLQRSFLSYQSGINSLAVSGDGAFVVTGGIDGTVKVWDLQGRQVAEFENEAGSVWGVRFVEAEEGGVVGVAIGGDDGSGMVRSWEELDVERLLGRGCKWLKVYLKNPLQGKTKFACEN